MQNNEFTENDWKLFRTRLAKWQEAYYTRLVREYTELLNGDGTPGEKIYELEQRVQNERKHSGVRLPFRMSRSMVIRNLCFLLRNPVTRADDLKDFSDELKEQIQFITETEQRQLRKAASVFIFYRGHRLKGILEMRTALICGGILIVIIPLYKIRILSFTCRLQVQFVCTSTS